MKFKDLTDDQIFQAKNIYQNKELSWDDRMKELMNLFRTSYRMTALSRTLNVT